jgi:hypothetical protein
VVICGDRPSRSSARLAILACLLPPVEKGTSNAG